MQLIRPDLALQKAAVLGQAVSANRWRAALLRQAAAAIGALLDDATDGPALAESVRDDLRDALTAVTMHALALEHRP